MGKYREGRDRHVAKVHIIAKEILVNGMPRNIQSSVGQTPDQFDLSFEVNHPWSRNLDYVTFQNFYDSVYRKPDSFLRRKD